MKYWTETAKLYEDLGDKIRAGSFWSKLGLMYHLGAYDKVNALASYERAKSLLDNGTSDGSLSDVLMNLSVIKFWDGDVGGGSELLEEAMILSKKSKVFETESMGYQLVAGFPFSMKNQALESIDKGLQLALEHDYFQIASYGYFHRAVFNVLVRGASKDAERLFVEGLEYASKVGFSPIELWLTSMLVSEVYSRLGYWDKANEIATKLYESVTSMPAAPSLVRLIGTVTLGCLLVNRGDFTEPETHLKSVVAITKGFGALVLRIAPYLYLGRLYTAKNNFEEAGKYLDQGYELAKRCGLVVEVGLHFIELLSAMVELDLKKRSSLEQALTHLSEMKESAKIIDENWAFAYSFRAEGILASNQMDFEKAIQSLEKSMECWQELELAVRGSKDCVRVGGSLS